MPYGSLGAQALSQASRTGLEKAADWWQKSMQTSRHKTYFVLAGYDDDAGQEVQLRKEALNKILNGQEQELLNNIIEISASNEVGLAQKITRVRDLLPIETITVFVESRNAVSVKEALRAIQSPQWIWPQLRG